MFEKNQKKNNKQIHLDNISRTTYIISRKNKLPQITLFDFIDIKMEHNK